MQTATESLQAKKLKYLMQIDDMHKEIRLIQAKVDILNEILAEEDKSTEQPNKAESPRNGFGLIDNHRYSKMGLSEAAVDAVYELNKNHVKDITRTKVGKYMQDMGFNPKGENFLVSVDVALRRAVENKKIGSTLNKEGRRIYTASPLL